MTDGINITCKGGGMTDCLIIGFNDVKFDEYVDMVAAMGKDSGAYRDLYAAMIEYKGAPYHALGILNHFHFQGLKKAHKPFHYADLLWPSILYLGTYLSKRGLSFDYINSFQQEKTALKEKLKKGNILTIAITTTVYLTPHPVIEIISFIRKYNRKVKIIVGGPYVINQTRQSGPEVTQNLFSYIGADFYVIHHEGEYALWRIIMALKTHSQLSKIDNIAYKHGERYELTPASEENNSLEENLVDYTLFRKKDIGEFVSIATARSCPFACAYCGFPQKAGKYRFMSVEYVEKTLNAIRNLGTVTSLTFLDDTFNVPAKRFKEILRMMIRNNYGYKWNSFYRCDHGDEETIALMKEAGCEGVFLGIESGCDSMLQRMNKTARRRHNEKAIALLKSAGILTHVSLIVGFPGETHGTVQQTIEFIQKTAPDFFRAQLWYCDPLTPVWKKKEAYEIKGSGFNWSHKTMDYRTACDLIDEIFLSVDSALWLPQYGFELWSLFYLQQRGMHLDRIKGFIKCFNTAIREKLLLPEKKLAGSELIKSLKNSCVSGETMSPDMRAVNVYSGRAYIAAKSFWVDEFRTDGPVLNFNKTAGGLYAREAATGMNKGRVNSSFCIEVPALGPQTVFVNHISVFLMAAYGVLLSRLSGRPEAVFVSADHRKSGTVVPLRLFPLWDMNFRTFFSSVHQKFERAEEHGPFALHFLKNPGFLDRQTLLDPVFDAGYAVFPHAKGCNFEVFYPPVIDREIILSLEVFENPGDLSVHFSYNPVAFDVKTIEALSVLFGNLLKYLLKNPDMLLDEIPLCHEITSRHPEAENEACQNFIF